MTRGSKIMAGVAIAVAGLTMLAILAAVLMTRSTWFSNYVREKIVSAVENSTGGKTDLRSFSFDWHTLTVTLRGFVIHGTEPAGDPPLFEAPLIVLELKLFTTFEHMVDLESLRVEQPAANVLIFPNGESNIPIPKMVSSPNQSGLERVVDLAIHRLDISNGTVQFEDRKIAFNAHGGDVRIQWLYDPAAVQYQGSIAINPLHLASASNAPLDARLNIPVVIAKHAIRISNATVQTAQSKLTLSAQIQNLAAPDVDGQMTAHLALNEFARSFHLPIHPGPKEAADISVALHSDPKVLQIQSASIGLNSSHLELAGNLRTGADVHAVISLPEAGELLNIRQQPEGSIEMAGTAVYNDSKYSVAGKIDATGVGLRGLPSRLSDIAFTSAFQIDPDLISVSDLHLSAMGGTLTGGAQLHDLKTVNAAIGLHGFTIRGLSALAMKPLNYGGAISGTIQARGSLDSPDAQANLIVAPQAPGVPVSGRLQASYSVASGIVALYNSELTLPHTRILLSGETGHQAEVQVVSRNLSDFQPALAMISSAPPPVALNGGEARFDARLRGPLATPSISGNINLTHFQVSGRPFDRLSANFAASPSGMNLSGGSITRNSSMAQFAASVGLRYWRTQPQEPLSATVTIRGGDLADAFALAGENPSGTRGQVTADARVSGTIDNPQGTIQASVVDGTIREEPFTRIALDAALTDRLITLQSLEAVDGAARIDARGSFTHPRDSLENGRLQFHLASSQIPLSQFKTLDRWRPGLAGTVHLNGDVVAELSTIQRETKLVPRSVNADLNATGIRDSRQDYGDLTATASTEGSSVHTQIESNFAGSSIRWNGTTQLAGDYPTNAQASVHALNIEKLLELVPEESIPVKGILSANARISGTVRDPRAGVTFDLTRAAVFDEPIEHAQGSVEYSDRSINVPSLEVADAAGRIDLHGSFSHPPSSFESGELELHVATSAIQLQRIHAIEQRKPGLNGTLQFTGDLTGQLETRNGRRELLPTHVAANGSVDSLSIDKHALGGVKLEAETSGNALAVKLESDIGKSAIQGTASIALGGNYAAQGKLTFAGVTYSGLKGLVNFDSAPPGFEASAAGEADFSGPLLQPTAMAGTLQIGKLEISATGPAGNKRIAIQNDGPLVAHLNRSTLTIDHARLSGPLTHTLINGSAGFSKTAPVDITIDAAADLSVVKQLYPGAYSGGGVTLQSTIRGTLSTPVVNGKIVFKNASLQMETWPNGMYNTNGTILLNGRTATIQSFQAESGGGKISASGFLGFAGAHLNYDVHASAAGVRVRYFGASILANASANLSGTSQHSVLDGTVTVERFAYSQQTDLGSILAGNGTVPPAQSAGAGFLTETRLNIRVQTAPGLQFQTSAAQELAATADLTVVGTLASPGMVGRISVTEGNLLFFGNKYTVNRGTISFYDALAIRPIVDIDLQTLVQGVTVDIGVSGPIQNLKLTYHSDPPLRFEDIIALLAAGTTPPDPTIAAQQPPEPDQTATQMGESALLGQAVANPVASRLQRVFGVSRLVVSPEFVTGSAIPQARVTVQQQVSQSVTFTYSQDLNQTNSQLLRIEWDLTARFSAVAERDENGIFGVDFFYRKQFH